MTAIGPGDLVEAIRTVHSHVMPGVALTGGAIYHVLTVSEDENCYVCMASPSTIFVVKDGDLGWCSCCFRPAGRRDESLIDKLMEKPVERFVVAEDFAVYGQAELRNCRCVIVKTDVNPPSVKT